MSCFCRCPSWTNTERSGFLRSSVERAHFVDDDVKIFRLLCGVGIGHERGGGTIRLPYLRKIRKTILSIQLKIRKAIQWNETKSAPNKSY